jgi:hypothetical protein
MTDADERLAAALRHDAPPPRDARFRLQVIERRERRRFRRRAVGSLTAVTGVAVTSVLAVGAGADAYGAGSVLLFALVLVSAAVVHLPAFGRLLRGLSV